jgi:mono/diheme cytochrome c family protein
VTEIPEHLLKRSQERRAAAGGESAPAATPATTDAATPAVVAKAAAPAKVGPAVPPPPKPDPVYVAAAKARKKIPFWAMATLSLLPIWGFMYFQGIKPQAKALAGPLGEGDHVYKSCQSCHSPTGAGGAGRQLNQGEVLKTFPHIEDQLNYVYNGSAGFQLEGLKVYGDPAREGGARAPGSFGALMYPQALSNGGSLTEVEILAVVCHERYSMAGNAEANSDKWKEEYELWCSPEAPIWVALEEGAVDFDNLHEKFAKEGVLVVGTKPRPATAAGE